MAGKNIVSDEEEEMDVEEEEHGDAVDSDEDDDEEDDGPDEYVKDDFFVDDVEEDDAEEADSDREKQKKKKKKKKDSEKNYVLDEDDYALLEDNNITGFRRPKESQKFKRLRKAQTSAGGDDSGNSDEELAGSGKRARTAEEKLKRSLFGDDEGPTLEDAEEEERPMEEDDMSDFIVSGDEYDYDEQGQRVRQRKVKKKPRQAQGVSSSALQEAHDIFGDVDEFLMLRKQGLAKMGKYDGSNEWGERRLEDEFEPLVLSEKYMTEKDDEIRQIDIPERMQIAEETTGQPPTDEISIEEESSWICNQLLSSTISLLSTGDQETIQGDPKLSINKDDVTRFLELMHIQKLDVPFIAMYRKEECLSLFRNPGENETDEQNQKKPTLTWHKVLWAIQDLNRKWLLLQKRKSALQSYYNKRFNDESSRIYDESRLALNKQLFKSIMESLKAAESEREVDDVDSKFNLHFPPGEAGVDEGHYKRPKRKSLYSVCSKSGLWEVASKFGYSSEQFGLQISLEKMRMDELEDARETPDEMASNFTCLMFETPQAVLKGARHMAAVEISCEPCVRKHVRCIFMDNAVVSTKPTPDGNTAIDSFHQFAGVKWLRDKPLTKFEDAQWLLIQKAEEEKLLQVTIKLPDNVLNKLLADSNEHYLSDGVSKSAQLWNDQRKMILKDAFSGFLLPSMEKEARSLLSSKAKSWLRMEYGKLLWDKVSVSPYQRKENDLSSDDESAPRVMACCWGAGKPSTTFVMLDSSGEVVDTLDAGFLSARSQNINDQQRKRNDQQRVLKFLMDHQPHVMVLGAVNLSCSRLKDDIYEIIFKIVEDNPRDVGHEMDGLSIVYVDERLSRLYENSRISSDQLSGHSGIIKRAVALGRYLQNPLAMVATLCGPGREILSWNLSPLESFLTPDEKYGMIEQVMVDATNQVGLDVNLAIAHEWLFSPLQFISGLGPRKAASLQRSLVRTGSIYTRKDLLTAHGIGKKVFVNAVGFLRIRRTGLAASSNQFIDLLDDTRIHPESYGLAQELAKFVYTLEQGGTIDDDDDVLEMAIEHVREKPDSLKYFEVDKYAESKGLENKNVTLDIVRLELIQGFQDWRRQYRDPSPDEEFYMISGETDDTLFEGRVVQVTVRRVQAQKAICGLESGLTGILNRDDYSDDRMDDTELTEKLHEGDVLTCKIKSIVKNRYQVFLTCKENEMRNNRHQNHQVVDPYYHEDRSSLPGEPEKARKEKELAKKHFKPRMIVHPRFQNITADEAIEFLSGKDPGESIVRPSSRGPSYLTLTLKVYDGVYAHKDIVEGGKEHKDITSLLRIGKTLKIGDDTFEDLDEVMDRYVDPLVTHLKAMLSYRKFRKGTKSEVDELLKIEKSEYPMRIVYCFGISVEHPGTFILTFIRSTNPHHEYISLYPKGFKFRKKLFEDIDRLVAYFQRHIDDPQHESGPSIMSVAARVPMRSPATGGGGWGGSGNDDVGGQGRGDDNRNGGNRDGHPSGIPRPYGGGRGNGRGRGRGPYNGGRGNNSNGDGQDTDNGAQKWGAKDDSSQGWSNFPGAKVQNSPGKEAFPGGWGSSGGGSSGGSGGWGSSGGGSGGGSGGCGSSGGGSGGGSGGWGSSGGGSGGSSGGWGNSGDGGGNSGSANGGGNGGWGSSGNANNGGSGGWGSGGGGSGGSSGGWGNSGSAAGGGSGGWGSNGGSAAGGGSGGWGSNGGGAAGGGSGSWGSNGGSAAGGGSGGWGSSGGGAAGGGSGGWGSNGGGGSGGGWGQGSDGGSGGRGSGGGGNREGGGGWGQGGRGGNRDDGGSGFGQGSRGGRGRGRGGNRDGAGSNGGGWSQESGGGRGGGFRGGRGGNRDGGGRSGGRWGGSGSGRGGNNDGSGNNGGSWGQGSGGGSSSGGGWGSSGGGSSGGGWGSSGGGSGWGATKSSPAQDVGSGGSGWGAAKSSPAEQNGSSWGGSKTSGQQGGGSSWGAPKSPATQDGTGGGGSGWGATKSTAPQDGSGGGGSGWGTPKSSAPQGGTGGGGSGWGATKSPAPQDGSGGGGSGWGTPKSPAPQGGGNGGGSGWGAEKSPAPQGASGGGSGWGATKSPAPQGGSGGGGSGWGAEKSPAPQAGGSGGGSGWGAEKSPAPQGGSGGGWGATKSPVPQGGSDGGGSGWGAPKSPAPQGGSGGGGSGWGGAEKSPAPQGGGSGSGWGAPKSPAQKGGSGGWGSSGSGSGGGSGW